MGGQRAHAGLAKADEHAEHHEQQPARAGPAAFPAAVARLREALRDRKAEADALALGGHLLAVERQGDGAVERAVVGVAVERDDQGAARLQDGDDLEKVAVGFGPWQRSSDRLGPGPVVVPFMRGGGPVEEKRGEQDERGKSPQRRRMAQGWSKRHRRLPEASSMPRRLRRRRAVR